MDKTFCSKSSNCKRTSCPRHLKGFNGLYISLCEFNCEEVLNEQENKSTREEIEYISEQHTENGANPLSI